MTMGEGKGQNEGGILLPLRPPGPVRTTVRRLTLALATVATMSVTVLLDRDGYQDGRDGSVSVLDAVYYAGVSLSTTGYGDIVPVSDAARLANVVVIMPLRVFVLVLLVGTTFEVLTQRTRRLSAQSPAAGEAIGDLLVQGHDLHLIDRPVRHDEIGSSPAECEDLVLAVVRDGQLVRYDMIGTFAVDDRLIQLQTRH